MKLPKDDAFPQLGDQSTDKLFNFILMICEQAMCAPHFKQLLVYVFVSLLQQVLFSWVQNKI